MSVATPVHLTSAAILAGGCDGYPAGTTGAVIGGRDGCVVFAPDEPDAVARWARPRAALLVPPGLVVRGAIAPVQTD